MGSHAIGIHDGRSLLEFLVRRGFDTYLLDWGDPKADDGGRDFESCTTHPGRRRAALLVAGGLALVLTGCPQEEEPPAEDHAVSDLEDASTDE